MVDGSERPIRTAIVGTGFIADVVHAPALRELGPEQVDFVAAVEVDEERLAGFADRWEVRGRYTEIKDMLAAEHPDLVIICSPPAVHLDQIRQAIGSGAWVWCEKPATLSLAEYDDITALERDGGPYVPIVFQQRFGSGMRHAQRLLRSGCLGRPLVAHCQTTWYRDRDYFAAAWRGTFTGDGGPAMVQGIHQMDMLLALLGPWYEVYALSGSLVHSIETGDVSVAVVRFDNGALATVVNSLVSSREVSHLRIDTELATVELTHLYGYGNDDWTYTPAPGVSEEVAAGWVNSLPDERSVHGTQLRLVLADLRAGRRPETSGVGGRGALELASAIYKAALTGTTVKRGDITADDPFYYRLDGGLADSVTANGSDLR